jgi:hypothetical protein
MKATAVHQGTLYVCTDLDCGRTAEFGPASMRPPAPHRCLCGSLMKRPYSTPSIRILSKDEASELLGEAPGPKRQP